MEPTILVEGAVDMCDHFGPALVVAIPQVPTADVRHERERRVRSVGTSGSGVGQKMEVGPPQSPYILAHTCHIHCDFSATLYDLDI
jgi:hypothetical protein